MIKDNDALLACAALLDSIGRADVPICVYDEALYARYDDFGSATYGAHRLIYMSPQGMPPNPKRTYVNDVRDVVQAPKKHTRTKFYRQATTASSLF